MTRNRKIWIVGLLFCAALVVFVGCKKDAPPPDSQPDQVSVALDGTSTFAAGVKIQAGGEPIDVRIGHLVPCAVDWNNDGKKDLVVGEFNRGAILLYLNTGTDTEPTFQDFSLLQAGDRPIKLDAG